MPGSHSKKDKLKKKIAKVRKADQQDINRVKRWNSRTFNKKKELSGPTEPMFKPTANLRNRLAKIRKADGGVAPNYNNPSKVRKKKTATKAAAKSKSGYMGDASVNIPWGDPDLGDEVNITFRDMAQFHRKNMWTQKQGTYPQIWNLGPLTGEGQGARQIFDAAHDVENRFIEEMGVDNYQKNMQSEIDHLIKEYGEDPEGDLSFNEELTRTQDNLAGGKDTSVPQSRRNEIKRRQKKEKMARQKRAAGMANIGKKPWMQKDYLKKKGKHLEKTALRSNVNKGVNKVNPIKPTKTYKKPVQGPNPHAETPEGIRKNAEVVGRKNDTYIGKITKKKTKDYLMVDQSPLFEGTEARGKRKIPPSRVSPDAGMVGVEDVSDLEKSLKTKRRKYKLIGPNAKSVSRSEATHMSKLKKRVARIRKAGEQVDPRVKKRKTVRPDSPVQKVSQMKDRIAELKTAKEHSHSIAFRKHEGQYYKRASLTKQEGKYAKYWLLNAKQTNGNGWGVSPTSIAKNINKFIGRPFVVTAKQWVAESEYGEQFEHPYLPTNNIDQIINHQEKFRVGSIVDVVEKDGDYHAVIEINSKFANMMLPPFCSPAIFQNNPGEADGEISDWEALHLAGLMEDPAYGARIALLKGSCVGTAEACSIQFKAAKQTTMCPKKKGKLVRRINRLGD